MTDIKVTSCTKAKEVNGKPIYKVTLSDGRAGESFAVEIPQGTPADDLNIEETQYGLKFKMNKKNGFAGMAKPRAGNESFALAYARDIVVAMVPRMEKVPTSDQLAEVCMKIGDKFYSWLESKTKK